MLLRVASEGVPLNEKPCVFFLRRGLDDKGIPKAKPQEEVKLLGPV